MITTTRREFAVDNVEPATEPIWTEPLSDHVAKHFMRKVVMLATPERQVVNIFGDHLLRRGRSLKSAGVSRLHPLIDAVHIAFSQHRPLTLSPDSIWLTIAQGFSHHITENAEAFRHRLVRHSGKKELVEAISDLNIEQVERAIAGFSSQIRDASDPVLHETLLCDFSTTTPEVRTASEVVLMDCYASYFEYVLKCVCGIPKIKLTGNADDWRRIRARVEVLATFGFEWWVNRLRPILDQFVSTAEGKPDTEFWQAIYKPKESYVSETVTGWIADLFPYLGEPSTHAGYPDRRCRSNIFECKRTNWLLPDPKFGVSTKSFPFGLASVPIMLMFSDKERTEIKLDMVGGFLGVEQDGELSLSPVISWAVTERVPITPVMID